MWRTMGARCRRLPCKLLFILSFSASRNVINTSFQTLQVHLHSKCTPNASRQVALMLPIDFFPINLLIGILRVWFREAWKMYLMCGHMKRNLCSPGFKITSWGCCSSRKGEKERKKKRKRKKLEPCHKRAECQANTQGFLRHWRQSY